MVSKRSSPSFGLRRGLRLKPRRLLFPPMFYWKTGGYALFSVLLFGSGSYWLTTRLANTSYIVVFCFLLLVFLSNLLSKKCIQLLRRYGTQ